LGDIIKALTFALPFKKWVAKKAKRSLKVWKQQHESLMIQQGKSSAIINLEFDVNFQ